jgi:hypothetical protein
MAARTAFVIALALNSVNREQSQQIVNPSGLPMNADCVHRDQVFANLNTAMTEAGLTSADILRESAALDAVLEAGQGFVTMNQDGSYIYNNNSEPKFSFSQEEQTLFQKFVEIFRQLKNCVDGTFELLRGMNLLEQLNALLLASGLVGFATQCVKFGNAIGTCAINTADHVRYITTSAGNATLNGIRYLTNNIFRTNTADERAHTRDDDDDDDDDETKKIVKNILRGLTLNISQQQINKKINPSTPFYSIQGDLDPIISQLLRDNPPNPKYTAKTEIKKSRINSESQLSNYDYDSTGGRPRTKRRRNKGKSSKRRRPHKSSKKRRHYKTKKRVYRSTRFRTHR